jgi:RNA polymerase sigma-70 factor (ECF subfamily)
MLNLVAGRSRCDPTTTLLEVPLVTFPSTHDSLLLALRDGDHHGEGWKVFESRYRGVIFGWYQRRDLPPADFEDFFQDLVLRLFQTISTYNPAKALFRSWLKTVVNNMLTDYSRKQRRRLERGGVGGTAFLEQLAQLESPETADELSGVIEDQAKLIAAEVLKRVRARVEEKTWQAFDQYVEKGRSAPDVAAELGLRVATVYRYANRVKNMVKEEYRNVQPP